MMALPGRRSPLRWKAAVSPPHCASAFRKFLSDDFHQDASAAMKRPSVRRGQRFRMYPSNRLVEQFAGSMQGTSVVVQKARRHELPVHVLDGAGAAPLAFPAARSGSLMISGSTCEYDLETCTFERGPRASSHPERRSGDSSSAASDVDDQIGPTKVHVARRVDEMDVFRPPDRGRGLRNVARDDQHLCVGATGDETGSTGRNDVLGFCGIGPHAGGRRQPEPWCRCPRPSVRLGRCRR